MKVKKVEYLEVDYNEINKAVKEFLKEKYPDQKSSDYECVAYEEWNNDSSHEININPEEPSEWETEHWEKGEWYGLQGILNWMCFEEKILPGTYLVKVCW